MSEEKLLTVRDAAIILGISEKELLDLAESGTIPAYKVGGVYLRFKRDQIQEYKKHAHAHLPKLDSLQEYSFRERLSDFFYFNDFYILAGLVITALLVIIFQGY